MQAGDTDRALRLATRDWFLDQARSLRPVDAVQADVNLALQAAGDAGDPLAVLRLALLGADLEQREYFLSEYDVADRLAALGDLRLAIEAARDGDRLRIGPQQAMALAVRLAEAGFPREGSRLFELTEPYDLLTGQPDQHAMRDRLEALGAWAQAAPRFRAVPDVLSRVRSIPPVEDEGPHDVQRWILIRLAAGAAALGLWEDWWRYLRALRALGRPGIFDLFLWSIQATRDLARADRLLRTLLRYARPAISSLPLGRRLDVAELLLPVDPDETRMWLAGIATLPLVQSGSFRRSTGPTAFQRFRFYKLQYALNERRTPDAVVAADVAATTGVDGGDTGLPSRKLALALTTLADLWGSGHRGDRLSPPVLVRRMEWVIRALIASDERIPYELGIQRTEILPMMVDAAVQHGREAVEAVVKALEASWSGPSVPHLRRSLSEALVDADLEDLARPLVEAAESTTASEPPPNPRERVDVLWDQASASLRVGDLTAARHHLVAMIDGARGPLDDHDHQLEVWARWMSEANRCDPARAQERIVLMLRRLAAVEASGVREAASETVRAATRWSPRRAVPVVQHVQELDLLSHSEAVGAFVEAICDAPDPPIDLALHLVGDLLVPLGQLDRRETVAALLRATSAAHGQREMVRAARYLVGRARADAIPTDRPGWLSAIAHALRDVGANPQDAGLSGTESQEPLPSDSSSPPERLTLTDGRVLTPREARALITSPESFEALAALEDSNASRFWRWHSLAELAIDQVSRIEQVPDLADALVHRLGESRASTSLARLARRVRALGDPVMADVLAGRALDLSDPTGWDPWADGGTRIEAYDALAESDPEARSRAVPQFAHDLATNSHRLHRVIHHTERLADLFFATPPVLDLWAIIERYLDDLFRSSPVSPLPDLERAIEDATVPAAEDTPARAGADLVALYLDHPAYTVTARATAVAAAVLVASVESADEAMPRALLDAARQSEDAAYHVLTAVAAAAAERPECADPFVPFLESLWDHPDVFLRLRSARLLAQVRGTDAALSQGRTPLSGIYQLTLPPLSLHESGEPETAALLDDPARVLRPLDVEARSIAEAAEVDEDAVMVRAVHLLGQFRRDHPWMTRTPAPTPENVLAFLKNAGLRVAHAKPHVAPAERALRHIAGELWDAESLPHSALLVFARRFDHSDPDLVLRHPSPRPEWVSGIGGLDSDNRVWSVPDGWLDTPDESLARLQTRMPDGWVILGESTRLGFIGTDQRIEETRHSAVRPASIPSMVWAVRRQEPPFYPVRGVRMGEYLMGRTNDRSLIIYPGSARGETPGMGWAALDSGIARDLGWTHDPSGVGRWVNDGVIMVETLWWRDGDPDRHDWRRDCTVGEGWLVVASPQAWSAIRAALSGLVRETVVHRRLGFWGSDGHRPAHRTVPIQTL